MKKNELLLRVAKADDAIEIHNLMQEVYNRLEDKNIYVCDDLEYVQTYIVDRGFAVVACNISGKIAASFVFRYPMLQADNLGRDIGLAEEELPKVVHMESAVVLPEYRGQGLQYKMLQYAEKIIDTSKFRYFMATVSPDNPASYKTFEKSGYQLIMTKEKYNGLKRRIYCKIV